MYKLRLYINPDKDFYYENTLNPDKKETTELYYEYRTDLTKELIAFYEHFAKTISSKDYLKDSIDVTVRYFEKYIKQILKKIETFYIDMDFGNQNIVIDVSQCEMLKEDGHIRIKEIENPNFLDFDYLHSIESIEENYNWEELEKLDDFLGYNKQYGGLNMAEHMVDVNDEDFRELLRIMRNYDKETLAEVIYYACETNRETVKLINEINLYMAGIKKVR